MIRYRNKLILLLVALALLTNGVLLAIMYTYSRRIVYQQIQSKVLSITATAASFIDGDLHKDIKRRSDEQSPSYKSIEDDLRRARDANRRDDVYVEYMYTMTLSPENQDILIFGVDPEERMEDKSHVGDVYKGDMDEPHKMEDNQVDNRFTIDQWGTWLTASSPIRDRSGNAVASLGVDIDASDVTRTLNRLLKIGLLTLGAMIVISIVVSLIVSSWVSRPLYALRRVVEAIKKGDLDARVNVKTNDEFGEVGRAINSMTEGLRAHETLKGLFTRYVSHQVAENILKSGDAPMLNSNRRRVTVLFSDIRNFTKMSEAMSPEKVVELLNEYFEIMVEVVFRNNGTLDKFIGDGLMAVYGAPLDDPYQEEHAIQTALEMMAELDKLCQKWSAEGRDKINIGIGINSGNAVVGSIGSTRRLEYTAVGDTVNLAARMESTTKEIGAAILISEYTYNAVRGVFKTKDMGSIKIKGRLDTVKVYSVNESNTNSSQLTVIKGGLIDDAQEA